MARILLTDDDGVECGLWEDCAKQIGSLVDEANRRKLAKDILRLVQVTRIKEVIRRDKESDMYQAKQGLRLNESVDVTMQRESDVDAHRPPHQVRHLLQMWLDLDDDNEGADALRRATRECNLRQWTHEWLAANADELRDAEQEIAILREELQEERRAHGQFGVGA